MKALTGTSRAAITNADKNVIVARIGTAGAITAFAWAGVTACRYPIFASTCDTDFVPITGFITLTAMEDICLGIDAGIATVGLVTTLAADAAIADSRAAVSDRPTVVRICVQITATPIDINRTGTADAGAVRAILIISAAIRARSTVHDVAG